MADIRPLNFGEILDAALTIYRRHFGLFLKLAVVSLSIPPCCSSTSRPGSWVPS